MKLVSRERLGSVYYGWWIVLACSSIVFLSAGVFFYGFTTILKPITDEFGWTMAAASFAFSLRSLESGIAAPLVGLFVDRVGARRVITSGVVVFGIALLALSRVNSLWTFYASFVLISLGISACGGIPGMTVVANWFTDRRSTALGVLMAGAGVGGLLVPLLGWLVGAYGWRTALVAAGLLVWAVGIPASRVVRDKPPVAGPIDAGPTGESSVVREGAAAAASPAAPPSYRLGQALRTRTFWLMSIALALSSLALPGLSVHLVPLAQSQGFSAQAGALMVTLMMLFSIVGRLGLGWLGDMWDKRRVLWLAFVLQIASLLLLAYVPRLGALLVALAVFGVAYGGPVTIRPAMQADYFGLRAFGKIQGVMFAVLTVGSIASPVFMGWVFDRTLSYQWALLVYAAATVAAVPLILSMPRPPARLPRPHVVSLR